MKRLISCILILVIIPVSSFASEKTDRYKSFCGIINKRNIFWPLWKSSQKTPEEIEKQRKEEELQRKTEQDKRMTELRQQEETQKQEVIRTQILNSLILNGIVDDGKQLVAFIQNKKQGNKTIVVKRGDQINDCAVISISQADSKVILEHKSKVSIELELKQ